jgi:hypothetical protein
MGPSKIIRNIAGSSNGPIHSHQQQLYAAKMGPIKIIGNFYRQLKWAHPRSSAIFMGSSNQPIQDLQQHFLLAEMGPFNTISNFSSQPQWAHPNTLAILFVGPYMNYDYYYSMGPYVIYGHSNPMGPCGLFHPAWQIVTWALPCTTTSPCIIMWIKPAATITPHAPPPPNSNPRPVVTRDLQELNHALHSKTSFDLISPNGNRLITIDPRSDITCACGLWRDGWHFSGQ